MITAVRLYGSVSGFELFFYSKTQSLNPSSGGEEFGNMFFFKNGSATACASRRGNFWSELGADPGTCARIFVRP